MFREPRRGRR